MYEKPELKNILRLKIKKLFISFVKTPLLSHKSCNGLTCQNLGCQSSVALVSADASFDAVNHAEQRVLPPSVALVLPRVRNPQELFSTEVSYPEAVRAEVVLLPRHAMLPEVCSCVDIDLFH